MSLQPHFPRSPYAPLVPSQRWFPADETLRTTAYEKLLPPLVAKIREDVYAWREMRYAGGSATSVSVFRWWSTPNICSSCGPPTSRNAGPARTSSRTEWQGFRTRQKLELEMTTAPHIYATSGRYTVAVKVIDIFGNDTMTLMPDHRRVIDVRRVTIG